VKQQSAKEIKPTIITLRDLFPEKDAKAGATPSVATTEAQPAIPESLEAFLKSDSLPISTDSPS
jgi:hypothetical protein